MLKMARAQHGCHGLSPAPSLDNSPPWTKMAGTRTSEKTPAVTTSCPFRAVCQGTKNFLGRAAKH